MNQRARRLEHAVTNSVKMSRLSSSMDMNGQCNTKMPLLWPQYLWLQTLATRKQETSRTLDCSPVITSQSRVFIPSIIHLPSQRLDLSPSAYNTIHIKHTSCTNTQPIKPERIRWEQNLRSHMAPHSILAFDQSLIESTPQLSLSLKE